MPSYTVPVLICTFALIYWIMSEIEEPERSTVVTLSKYSPHHPKCATECLINLEHLQQNQMYT